MPLIFQFDDEGNLTWHFLNQRTTELSAEETKIVAAAETARALRQIAEAIYELSDKVGDHLKIGIPAN